MPRQVEPVGFFPALIGLATTVIGAKKQSDAKKKAAAEAKKAEAEAAAAAAAEAAAAKAAAAAAAAAPAAQPAAQPGYYPQPYPAAYPAPYYPQPYAAPGYYPQPMFPQASMMTAYGGGYPQMATAPSRSRQNLTAQDANAVRLSQYRQLIDSRLSEARSKLAMAESGYRSAYSSGNRENAQAWYQYYNELQAVIAQLENQKIQYAA